MKYKGKKISSSHSTVTEASAKTIKLIYNCPEVYKISLGIIAKCNSSRGDLNVKIKDTLSGVELTVRGRADKQKVYVYISDPNQNRDIVRDKLTSLCDA
ncbi:MAG: hypothetical protein BWY19_00154 [bacterium ADurb.Bin212]|nr:MAG: hypothetical protein BWY19_00154 [bacterium ADurb.Bin212]